MIPSSGAALQLTRHADLRHEIANLTRFESSSVFAETQAALVQESIADSISLKSALSGSTNSYFGGALGKQMGQISKVIAAQTRGELDEERSTFFASLGAFDTHNYPLSEGKLNQVLLTHSIARTLPLGSVRICSGSCAHAAPCSHAQPPIWKSHSD